ncbi:ComEA family DNA-binding protein [Phascolarctobacterium sp.]
MLERGLRKKVAALGAVVVLCAGGSLWGSSPQETGEMVMPAPAAGVSAVPAQGVQVYVSGAVAKPGLYEVPAGSRAAAAIAAAGGMTLEANADKVNLAKLLKDGMQVNVPRLNAKQLQEQQSVAVADRSAATAGGNDVAVGKSSAVTGSAKAKIMGKVSLNTASAAELTALPGVGDVTAQRIVEYRASHRFASIEEIMQVKGIGKAKFAKMQPYLEL